MLMSQAYCGLNPKTWCEKENGSSWRRMKSKQAGKQPEISVKVIRTWNVKHGGVRLNFREQLPSQHVRPTSGQQLLVSNMKRINVTAVNVRCTPSNTWSIVTSQTYDTEWFCWVSQRGPYPFHSCIEVTENNNTDDSDPEECFMCVENSSQNMSGFERRFNLAN